jgi:hypothetical protein
MYGSTPTGNTRSYSYYVTARPVHGAQPHLHCDQIENQIPDLLHGLYIPPKHLAAIRALYCDQIVRFKGPNLQERLAELHGLIERLHTEEAALARLYAQGKLSDGNYDALYAEWRGKVSETQREINRLESGSDEIVDDLDLALCLLACIPSLFTRMEPRQQSRLLRILIKKIIIDTQGTVIDAELNPPFGFLMSLNPVPDGQKSNGKEQKSSSPVTAITAYMAVGKISRTNSPPTKSVSAIPSG